MITVEPTGIGTSESVPAVTVAKRVKPTSITTGAVIPAIDFDQMADFVGNLSDVDISGFADMQISDVAEGAGYIEALGRSGSPSKAVGNIREIGYRAIPSVLVTMDDPIVFHGLPRVPLIHSTSEASMVVTDREDHDDPSDDDDESSSLHRFKVGTLAAASEGSEYWLEEWEESGGGLKWESAYPYRPWVQHRTERLTDHTDRVYTRSLHFNNRYVEHMWLDLGAGHEELTIIVAAMFHGYRGSDGGHYVIDAGRQTPIYEDVVDGEKHHIDDNLDYRAAMIYKENRSMAGTADVPDIRSARHIRAKHDDSRKPKVLFTVFNGSDSLHGYWDMDSHKYKYGQLNTKSIRHLVLGRARNHVNRHYCADMTVFEVLIYTKALTQKQIKKRAKRLAGRYKFDKYWD